jgi:(1->4)-alpha-D-glucan 1-alpha-D-glucosylmutase
MTPRATYRLQFHKGFTFDDAAPLAPYLAKLGISHLYSSPILAARAGSTHGYDVVDHTRINPELGGAEAFERLARTLRAVGIGIIVDIVPNHMAVGGADNPWWLDVLEKGDASHYARFFDVQFDTPDAELQGKILAPFLGAPYGEVLQSGDLKLVRETGGKIAVAYHHHRFPIRPEDQATVAADLDMYNDPDKLHELLEQQNFRLAWWRTAGDQINWRRFFDITELAGLRVERPEVFDAVHAVTFDLYRHGLIDGVRIDHVDGLADPAAYCRNLRTHLDALAAERPDGADRGPAYIVVEKILGADEPLPADWGVDGTTGYDFMNQVSALQHDPAGEQKLTDLWTTISGRPGDFEAEELTGREEMLRTAFDRQLDAAAETFYAIAAGNPETRDLTASALHRALVHIIRHMRVYRTYATGTGGSPAPGPYFDRAVAAALEEAPAEDWGIQFIAQTLGSDNARIAVKSFNQLTAPVAAKAVEDTAFYRYGRLLSRNDVGFQPARLACEIDDFHAAMRHRAAAFPHAMLATATHDHKRGEDSRARLAVISEVADEWQAAIDSWRETNAAVRPETIAPDDEYQLYQTLVGAWPLDLTVNDTGALDSFRERVAGWRIKSLREAKLRSSWAAPDVAYEGVNLAFLETILDPARSSRFIDRLGAFVDRIGPAAAMNGLVQLVLRSTAPGMPDLYQGAEFWDFSMVDPDNRRPVDYPARIAALEAGPAWSELHENWRDGRIKQRLAAALLSLRANDADLFANGDYQPLTVEGLRKDNVLAFARRHNGRMAVVAVPIRCAAAVTGSDAISPAADWWADTAIWTAGLEAPADCLGRPVELERTGRLPLASVTDIPALVLVGDNRQNSH